MVQAVLQITCRHLGLSGAGVERAERNVGVIEAVGMALRIVVLQGPQGVVECFLKISFLFVERRQIIVVEKYLFLRVAFLVYFEGFEIVLLRFVEMVGGGEAPRYC